MESSSNTVIHSENCDMDNKIQIKEEPLHCNEISPEFKEIPVVQIATYFEIVPEKKELITCDTKVDIKEEPLYLNEMPSYINSELQEPPNSDVEPCVMKAEENIEMGIKEEPLWHGTASTQGSVCSTDAESQNEQKERELHNFEASTASQDTAVNTLPLESPRLPSQAFLNVQNKGSTPNIGYTNHLNQVTSMSQNAYILNFNPAYVSGHLDPVNNTGDASTKIHKCETCEASFTRKSNLKAHKLIHLGVSPYKCSHCDKCFIQKSTLRRHMHTHSGTKPYKCDICARCFSQKTTLQSHTFIHLDTKPHKCDTCGSSFTKKSSLQSHTLTHLGTKPYKCDTCGRLFAKKSVLNSHKEVHSGEKQHKCDICEKHFKRKSILVRHSLIHSGIKPHKCDTCGISFKQKSALNAHQEIHLGTKQ